LGSFLEQLAVWPNVIWGGFCEEIRPVGRLGSFNGFEVAELGLSCRGIGVGDSSFLALPVAFANFFRRVVRSGVHQALDLGEGRERGVSFSITVVSAERAEENHWSS